MSTAEGARVFVTDAMQGLSRLAGHDLLGELRRTTTCTVWSGAEPPTPAALREAVADCEGLLCLLTDVVDADVIAAAPRLRVVSSCSVGVDHVDLRAASERDIVVGNTPGVLTETTADLAFGLLLAVARRIVETDRALRAGAWTRERRWQLDGHLGRDLCGATLGLVGLGPIGRAVARRAAGFGMRVLAWSRHHHDVPGVEQVALESLLEVSDFVSVHVALAPETRGLLDHAALARMKPGAILINTARGGIVDEQALAEALASGRLGGAGLDVFSVEPLPPESPLLALDRVVLTPHIGSASVATRVRMVELAVENLLAGLAGRPLRHCANPEVMERRG